MSNEEHVTDIYAIDQVIAWYIDEEYIPDFKYASWRDLAKDGVYRQFAFRYVRDELYSIFGRDMVSVDEVKDALTTLGYRYENWWGSAPTEETKKLFDILYGVVLELIEII